MRIIDIHSHVYPDAIAMKAADSIRDYYQIGRNMDGTPGMLLDRGAQAGVTQYVILPVAIKADRVDSINQFILQQMQLHSEFVGFGAIHAEVPNIGDVAENIASLGLKGIKIHPDCQKFDIDDPRLFPMYEAMEGKLPVFLHMGDKRYNYSQPARLRHVLDLFPKLDAVAAHFGGYSMYEEACRQLKDKNCIMDVSSSLMFMGEGQAEHYINLYGAERMAFGTDYPVWDPVEEVQRLMILKLTDDQKEQIAWKTAARFLNL